jgi:actin-like ATPase involved in cell morphogenesis
MGIGFDCGTYNLVCCKRDEKKDFVYKREVNAFIEIPLHDRFVFNMMKDSGVPLIEWKEANVAYALGEAAVNIAYSMNQVELKRPMHAGTLNPKEKHAQQIMNIMVHSLLDSAKSPNENLYYSVPADAVNEETDADYHSFILKAMFDGFEDEVTHYKVNANPINEGLALVYAELEKKQRTGIGISFGGGMVNLCFSIFGAPVFKFALVNSGDWIDKKAAQATGESVAFINREKEKVNLMESSNSMVQRAIKAQYEIMIQKTVTGIKKGLEEMGNKARANNAIDVVIAGGTSSPVGFDSLFAETIKKAGLPIELGEIIRPSDPLYSVARGCLLAAEAATKN